jgi:hypothetical protein
MRTLLKTVRQFGCPAVAQGSVLDIQMRQNKRGSQTRETFSGILRALIPTALLLAHGRFLYTIFK